MEASELSSNERPGRSGWDSLIICSVKYSISKAATTTATAAAAEDRANHFEYALAWWEAGWEAERSIMLRGLDLADSLETMRDFRLDSEYY